MASTKISHPHRRIITISAVVMALVLIAANVWSLSSLAGRGEGDEGAEPVDQPVMDIFAPAADKVAVGDSTMALSDGQVVDWYQGCRHEKGTWVSKIGDVVNASCSGADVNTITDVAQQTGKLGARTSVVYITAGSNTARHGVGVDVVAHDLDVLYSTIRVKAPSARVVFVGYLTVMPGMCMDSKSRDMAHWIQGTHDVGNRAMKQVARERGARFVDDSALGYTICDQNKTYVRLPNTTKGTSWHTTGRGHDAIARNVIMTGG